jgi:hypothetical protein
MPPTISAQSGSEGGVCSPWRCITLVRVRVRVNQVAVA